MESTTRQLQAKVWEPLFRKFSDAVDRACLRRDAYLDHAFANEAMALKEEIPCRNSPEARVFLQRNLEDLDRTPVNFSLSPATIEAINRTCEELNVIRDCFINRVLFLLIADTRTCECITGIELDKYLPEILGDNDRDYLYAPLWEGAWMPFRRLWARTLFVHFVTPSSGFGSRRTKTSNCFKLA